MKRRVAPSLNLLREVYRYDPINGNFYFKIDVGTRGRVGCIAGARRLDNYIGIALGGKVYLAHHLAWYYVYGEWVRRIDHKNRIKNDNSIKNLRPALRMAKISLILMVGQLQKERTNFLKASTSTKPKPGNS